MFDDHRTLHRHRFSIQVPSAYDAKTGNISWLVAILASLTPLLWIKGEQEEKADSVFHPTISLIFVLTSYAILIPATLQNDIFIA